MTWLRFKPVHSLTTTHVLKISEWPHYAYGASVGICASVHVLCEHIEACSKIMSNNIISPSKLSGD